MRYFACLFLFFLTVTCVEAESIHCDATEASLLDALEKSRKTVGPKEIVIGQGHIFLNAPIELGERDSGLTLRGSKDTLVSGGRELHFSAVPGKSYWSATLPEGCPAPALLSIGTRNIPVAVYPVSGALEYTDVCSLIWLGSQYGGWTRPPRDYEREQITAKPGELPEFDPADAEVLVLHSWDTSLVRVKSVDRSTGTIQLANQLKYPAGAFGKKSYRIQNVEAGLVPGTWMYHRKTREVRYCPTAEDNLEELKATVSVMVRLLTIDGATDIAVRDLTFANCNATASIDASLSLNDPSLISMAILINNSHNVTLEQLVLRNCYGNGIFVTPTPISSSIRVLDCSISSIGLNAIHLAADGDSCVRNCKISNIGNTGLLARTYRGGHFNIADNWICGAGYCGIVLTCMGGDPKKEYDATIEKNEISRVMSNLDIQDGAAIYLYGADGVRVENNNIHDIPERGLRHGIYFDETSHACKAVENHVSGAYPVLNHKAKDIVFRNCVFDYTGTMTIGLIDSDCVKLDSCRFSAPEIIFSAPQDSLERSNCTINGKITDIVKKRNFTFSTDEDGILRCTKIPATKQARKLPRRIVCLGDSITAAGTFAGELQLYLNCRYPQQKIRVFNAGIGGDSAAGGFRRLERDVLSRNPDMVIICFGMNDAGGRSLYQTRLPENDAIAEGRKKGFDSYCENMENIVKALTEKNIEVVVMAPFPYDEYGTRPPMKEKKSDYYNSVGLEAMAERCYGSYASRFLFPMSRTMLCRLYAWFPELKITPDRVHPNRFGHWVIANEIAKTVFQDIPAQKPITFPATAEMMEFAEIGGHKRFPGNVEFRPMDVLLENATTDERNMKLRLALDTLIAAEGKLKRLIYYDNILRQKGVDPADCKTADPVLKDFATRWHLLKDLDGYFQERDRRDALNQEREAAEKAYFQVLESL